MCDWHLAWQHDAVLYMMLRGQNDATQCHTAAASEDLSKA